MHINQTKLIVVSYPDPNVRNDDYRLQYNITYRGSGNEVVGNGSWNVDYYITFMSSQMFRCVTKSIMAYAGGRKL